MSFPSILRLAVLACVILTLAGGSIASPQGSAAIPSTTGWYQIPGTQLHSVCPPNNFGGSGYAFDSFCSALVSAWSGGVFDTARNRLIVWGGGHNDYLGNEMYALDLDTLALARITDPAVPVSTTCDDALAGGTQPNSRHTYDGIEYMPNVDKMFVYGGSLAPCGNASTGTWAFNFANNQWEKKAPTGTGPKNNFGVVSAYDPNTGKVFLHDVDSLYSYNPVSNAYQKLVEDATVVDYHLSGAIDPKRKKFVMVGGGQAWVYNIGGSSFSRQTLNTTGGSAIVGSDYPGLAYDPTRDRIVAWNGGNAVYELNLDNNTWTSSSFPGGPATGPWGTFGHWQYSPASGVFVTLNNADLNAYTLRLSEGTGGGAAFDFSLSSSGTASAAAGETASATVSAALLSGVAEPIAFTVSGLPAGVAASFSPASCAVCTTTLTLTTLASTPLGTSALTVTGTSGSIVRTAPLSLTVSAPPSPPPPTGSRVTSFTLTPAVSGAVPFTVGLGFRKGDITGVPVLDAAASQVVVKSRWPDGSVRHAIASGRMTMTSGSASTVGVFQAASAPSGANLTSADIQAAAPSASVQIGSIGTVNLSSLLGTPFRTWISGPEMVEAHYRSGVGSDPSLSVWFYVRLYRGGRLWVRAVVENGFLDIGTSTKTYVPTVSIGGSTVYNNSGGSLSHYGHTRWTVEGWIGGSDPQVTARLDTAYLIATRLVPNYMNQAPPAAALNGLYQNYAPMQNGSWTVSMGETGFQDQIGLLPLWDALYVTSGGDPRAFKSVLANAKALSSYPIVWNDSATRMPATPSGRPTWTVSGANGDGATIYSAGPLTWDVAHHGSGGYLAYLLTGDYYYLETMEDQASLCYLIQSSSQGSGTAREFGGQTRAVAWCQRTVGQLAAIGPADSIVSDYRSLLAQNAANWLGEVQRPGQNLLGYLYAYELSNNSYGPGGVAPWQQHFFVQTYGFVSDLEPLSDMTAWNAVRDHLYKSAVGILGTGGSGNYCFTSAGEYNIRITADNNGDAPSWFDSWGSVYQATFGGANPSSCGNTLGGGSGGAPSNASTGYWGNLLPAIAMAVDHGAPGAAAAWARLTGASNWNTVLGSGFNSTPIWGIVPRTPVTAPPPDTTPPAVAIGAPPAGATLSGSVTVSANASDDTGVQSVQFRLDGSNLGAEDTAAPYSVVWDTRGAGNGPHSLTAVAFDAAGNQAASAGVSVTVSNADATPPAVSVNNPAQGATVSNSITVSAAASDNVGVTAVQFKVDGVNLGAPDTGSPYMLVWDTKTVSDGAHTLTAVAFDAAGNQAASAGVSVTVSNADATPPAVSVNNPAQGATVSNSITVSAAASDNVGVAAVQFKVDGVNLGAPDTGSPYMLVWDTKTVSNGAHTLTAVAFDAAGNQAASAGVSVTVSNAVPDTTAPDVAMTSPAHGSAISGSVTVSADASDNAAVARVQFKLDGSDLGSAGTQAPFTIAWNTASAPNGSHTLTAVATDTSGNQSTSAPVSVTVNNIVPDTSPPSVSMTAPAAGEILSGMVAVSAAAADNVAVAEVQFKLDGIDLGSRILNAPYLMTWNTALFSDGPHTLAAVATDAAGNSTASAEVSVNVDNDVDDTSPPSVTVTAPAPGTTVSGPVTVSASASDNRGVAAVQFLLDGNNLGSPDVEAPFSIVWNSALSSNGTHTLSAMAADAAGNTGTAAVTFSVNNADVTLPQVSMIEPSPGSTVFGPYVPLSAMASDNAGIAAVQFMLDGAVPIGPAVTVAPYSILWNSVTADNGLHALSAVAMDTSGNETASALIDVVVRNVFPDTTPPAVSFTAPAPNAEVTGGSVAISASAQDDVAMAGVQFMLDGANIEGPVTAPPFSIAWNTAGVSNGAHLLTAVATDTSGNENTAGPLSVIVNNAAPDTTPPFVSVSSPKPDEIVSGSVAVLAAASDESGVATVRFFLDGIAVSGELAAAPYSMTLDTTAFVDGRHSLTAVARDTKANPATSPAVSIVVRNALPDTTPPVISISAPIHGSAVGRGTAVLVSAAASDDTGIAGIQFFLDGAGLGSEIVGAPYNVAWDTAAAASGAHRLGAIARDAAGNRASAAAVTITIVDPLPPTVTYSIPPGGGLSWLAAPGDAASGSATILPGADGSASAGVAIVGIRAGNVLISEAGIPTAGPVQSGRFIIDTRDTANAGIVVANPSDQEASVSFSFRDGDGKPVGAAAPVSVPARGQVSYALTDPRFALASGVLGMAQFAADRPVALVPLRSVVNERRELLVTTLPVLDGDPVQGNALVFPHFADGGGWRSRVVLMNPTPHKVRGTVQFVGTSPAGVPVESQRVSVRSTAGSAFDYEIPAMGTVELATEGLPDEIRTGWVRVTGENGPVEVSGTILYAFTRAGTTVSEAGFPPVKGGTGFRLYAELTGAPPAAGGTQTGVAITNVSNAPLPVTLQTTNLDGTPTRISGSLTIPAGGHQSLFINEILPGLDAPFRGTLSIESPAAPVYVMALRGRYNERGDFLIATTPASSQGSTGPGSTVVLPYLPSGGGFSTEMIIFNEGPASAAGGAIYFWSPLGALQGSAALEPRK